MKITIDIQGENVDSESKRGMTFFKSANQSLRERLCEAQQERDDVVMKDVEELQKRNDVQNDQLCKLQLENAEICKQRDAAMRERDAFERQHHKSRVLFDELCQKCDAAFRKCEALEAERDDASSTAVVLTEANKSLLDQLSELKNAVANGRFMKRQTFDKPKDVFLTTKAADVVAIFYCNGSCYLWAGEHDRVRWSNVTELIAVKGDLPDVEPVHDQHPDGV